MGKSARRFLWRYLVDRDDGNDPDAPLFAGKFNRPFNRDALRQLINSLGAKVGIKKCHPHRFRHTFAITYLRSGGDIFTLKALLGHGSLDMGAYENMRSRSIKPIVTDIANIDEAVMAYVNGQIVDHVEKLH